MPYALLDTWPDLFAHHAQHPVEFPVLLESGGEQGWDMLMAYPGSVERFFDDNLAQFFERLHEVWRVTQQPPDLTLAHLPFRGGWLLYLGYEALHVFEPTVVGWTDRKDDFPQAVLMQIPAAVLQDKVRRQTWVYADDEVMLRELCVAMQRPPRLSVDAVDAVSVVGMTEEDANLFLDAVQKIQAYITAGDVFQVNLSRRWQAKVKTSPQAIYRLLRQVNPAPFSASVRFSAEHTLLSASPERLFRRQGSRLETRPIAGTIARVTDARQDDQLRAALLAHPKERAEHIMLVDLERNDLGRVCLPGSIRVEELMGISTYAFVHHIESTVSGKLRSDIVPLDLLRALFPGGTITGCPKVRTMQIIRELESSPRGAYTGSFGYLNRDGDMDMNILIRSFAMTGDQLRFSAGAGIVADSVAVRELAETRAKARGMLRALGIVA